MTTEIADFVPAGIIHCDAEAKIRGVNACVLDWMGLDSDKELLDRPFFSLLAPAGKIYFETHLRPMLALESRFDEISLEIMTNDNQRIPIYLNGQAEKNADGSIRSLHFACFEGSQRRQYEQELLSQTRKAEAYEALVQASPDAIINIQDDLTINSWNPAAERLLGYTAAEVVGKAAYPLIIPDDQRAGAEELFKSAERNKAFQIETVYRHKSGERIPVEASVARLNDEHGRMIGVSGILRDIRERKKSEALIDTLNLEMIHRSKNQLAVIQAIASSTARHSSPDEFIEVFLKRLEALSRNLTLLADRRQNAIELDKLIEQQLSHLGGELSPRITVSGGPVKISPEAAEAIGMAIFELSTNAVKYGALSAISPPEAHLDISWSTNEETDDNLDLWWREDGLLDVVAPEETGFGSKLTGQLLEHATGGVVRTSFHPGGLHWHLRAPVDILMK